MKDQTFTGDSSKGNPYEDGLAYDVFEANTPCFYEEDSRTVVSTMYRIGARKSLRHFSAKKGDVVFEAGAGTGISTLELLSQNHGINVVALEQKKEMVDVARYKFHQADGKGILDKISDDKVLRYLEKFREESLPYRDSVRFVARDFMAPEVAELGEFDGAVGIQFMHWIKDLSLAFEQFSKIMKPNSRLIWTTASHYFNDANLPSLEFGFRYNDFVAGVFEELRKEGLHLRDLLEMAVPRKDINSVQEISLCSGFETTQVATYHHKYDFQDLIRNHIFAFVKAQLDEDFSGSGEELKEIIRESISRASKRSELLKDTSHKIDIIPVFESRKIGKPDY